MSNKIFKLYKLLQKKHGNSVTSVRWRNKKSQELRFQILSEITHIEVDDKIMDVGSGLGDLIFYLRKKGFKGKYLGIDFIDEFILFSNRRFLKDKNTKFKKLNIINNKLPKRYDWIVLSGVFNDKHKNAKRDMFKIIKKMFSVCKKGIIFNSLSKHVDYEDKTLFYTYPEKVFKYCVSHLSKLVILKTDYELKKNTIPFEYTICVKKK